MTVLFSENSSEDLMAEKRPDQHNTDPGEAGSSDYKMRREGHTESEHPTDKKKGQEQEPNDDDARVDEASEESFPASDPPAY